MRSLGLASTVVNLVVTGNPSAELIASASQQGLSVHTYDAVIEAGNNC